MPYDSNGNASVTRNPAVTGQTVLAEQVNVPFADIQAMLGQVLLKSGVAPMTGPLNSNNFRLVNVGEATNDTDAATFGQLNDAVDALTINQSISNKSGNYTALESDFNVTFVFSVAATLTISLAADLRDFWFCTVVAYGGDVKILPNLLNTIDGAGSTEGITIRAGQIAYIYRTSSTAFVSTRVSDTYRSLSAIGKRGLELTRVGQFGITVDKGSVGSDEAIPYLMVLPSAYTKQINTLWAVGSGNGGLDTGAIGSGTYYAYIIRRPDTGIVDVLYSLSATTPTLPASYTQKALIGSFQRVDNFTMPFPSEPKVWTTEFGELNMPVGVTLIVTQASPTQRGEIMTIYRNSGNSAAYTADPALNGGQLLGVWRNVGAVNATICMVQKVSY